ncbi:hypothetical protein [Streptomyces sp. NPDC048361]|uniref:hypothetical protein n=1 Tax=Streptomyces sp. NPDC048361 TaxID=3154720 RepID=UPI00343D0601
MTTTRWEPYAYRGRQGRGQGHGYGYGRWAPGPAGRRGTVDGPDTVWWVAPAVCTLGLVLSVWLDLVAFPPLGRDPEYLVMLYGVPVGAVLSSWLLPLRRSLRALRVWLAAGGVVLGFVMSKLLVVGILVLITVFALMWGGSPHD